MYTCATSHRWRSTGRRCARVGGCASRLAPPASRVPPRAPLYQLSESTSLFSQLFSVCARWFHFCGFSGSSEDERFCRRHLARLFLNHTCRERRARQLTCPRARLERRGNQENFLFCVSFCINSQNTCLSVIMARSIIIR